MPDYPVPPNAPKPTQPVAPETKPAEPTQLPAEKDQVFFDKLTELMKSDTSAGGGKARLVVGVKALVKEHEAADKPTQLPAKDKEK